jgi:hypothetical protein
MEIVHVVRGEHPLDHCAGLRTSNQICIDQPIVAVEGPEGQHPRTQGRGDLVNKGARGGGSFPDEDGMAGEIGISGRLMGEIDAACSRS